MLRHSTCIRALIHLSSSREKCADSLLSALRSCHMMAWMPTRPRCGLMFWMARAPAHVKSSASLWASSKLMKNFSAEAGGDTSSEGVPFIKPRSFFTTSL
jgi:hypothetical protein